MSGSSRNDPGRRPGPGLLGDVVQGLTWFLSASPRWSASIVLLQIAGAVIPLAGLLVLRGFVDSITATALPLARTYSVLLGAIFLAGIAVHLLSTYASQVHRVRLAELVQESIHAKAMRLEYAAFESPAHRDEIQLALRESLHRPASLAQHATGLILGVFNAAAVSLLLTSFDVRIVALLLVVGIPAILLRVRVSRELFRQKKGHAERERRVWQFGFMLTDLSYAKELRLFGLGGYLRDRYRDAWRELRSDELRIARLRSTAEAGTNLVTAVVLVGTLVLISREVITAAISVGTAVMYYGALQRLLAAAQELRSSVAGLYEDSLFLSALRTFLDLPDGNHRRSTGNLPFPSSLEDGLALADVTLTYPGQSEPAVTDVSLSIRPGQLIGLAGPNGAGKSTIAKLLSGLYRPDSGNVLLEGRPLAEYSVEDIREHMTVLFQEQPRFPFSISENIALGDVRSAADPDAVIRAATAVGLHERIMKLPAGYDTPLGLWFAGGRELSSGEWQRLALARAWYRDAPIVILDEPTHALDALAEALLFDHIRALARGRTVLLISHHLGSLRQADWIYVLDRGTVIEQGTHETLVRGEGLYARMFRSQSARFN